MRVSLKVKLLRFPGFPGNMRLLSKLLEGQINKPTVAIAMLMGQPPVVGIHVRAGQAESTNTESIIYIEASLNVAFIRHQEKLE